VQNANSKLEFLRFSKILREKKCETRLSTRFTYLEVMEGWVDLQVGWLYKDMVYRPQRIICPFK